MIDPGIYFLHFHSEISHQLQVLLFTLINIHEVSFKQIALMEQKKTYAV